MLEQPAVTVFFCSLINLIKSDNINITSVKLLSLFIKLLFQTQAGILPALLPSPTGCEFSLGIYDWFRSTEEQRREGLLQKGSSSLVSCRTHEAYTRKIVV